MDPNEQFSLDAPQPQQQLPQEQLFDLSPQVPSVPPDVAANRALKYDFGLGQSSPGVDVLRHSIGAGQEDMQRTQAVMLERARIQAIRSQLIQAHLKN